MTLFHLNCDKKKTEYFFVNHMCFALPVLGLVRRCQAALD